MATFEETTKLFREWQAQQDPKEDLDEHAAFVAGAASRDAEIAALRGDLEKVYGIFGDYDHEIQDFETAHAVWNEVRKRECLKDEQLADLRSKIETARALSVIVKQTRTAWLEQNGVPISQEFVNFANSLGELLEAING